MLQNQRPTATVPKPGEEGIGNTELAVDGLARGYAWLWSTNQFPADDVGVEIDPWNWFLCNEP